MKTDKERNKNPYETAEIGYWKAKNKLTEEKLDIAVGALCDIHKHSYACCNPASEIGYIHAVCYNALEKIYKELEQINQKEEE